jgi:hypothetical protein
MVIIDVLLWSIPALILSIALLGIRRYSLFNVTRHVIGMVIVVGTLVASATFVLEPFVLILLGAIGGTLVGQAYEAEKRRAADRRRAVGLDDGDSMVIAGQG